jgi:hypothetical protein
MKEADRDPYAVARRLMREHGDAALDYVRKRMMERAGKDDLKGGAKWLAVDQAVRELNEASVPQRPSAPEAGGGQTGGRARPLTKGKSKYAKPAE